MTYLILNGALKSAEGGRGQNTRVFVSIVPRLFVSRGSAVMSVMCVLRQLQMHYVEFRLVGCAALPPLTPTYPTLPCPAPPCPALPFPALSDMLVCVYPGKGTTSLINNDAPLFSPQNSAPISPPCIVVWWIPGTRRKEKRVKKGGDKALGLIEDDIELSLPRPLRRTGHRFHRLVLILGKQKKYGLRVETAALTRKGRD